MQKECAEMRIKMKKTKQLKISTKITIIYLVLSIILLSILTPTVYFGVKNSLSASLAGNMQLSATAVLEAISEKGGTVFVDESALKEDSVKPGVYVQVTDSSGKIIYQSRDAKWVFEKEYKEKHYKEFEHEWSYLTETKSVGGQKIQIQVLGNIYFNDFLSDFFWMLLLLIPGYIILAAIGSCFLAGRALRPIRQITMSAKKISEGDLSERIDGITSHDEVGELADTFNLMIKELEVAFQRERQFTSDASHELRTPMTVITACTEDALFTEDKEIMTENLKVIQKENQRMTKMLSQLLMLSRGYEGRYHFQPEQLGLYDMVESVSESLEGIAGQKSIHIHNQIPKQQMIYADQSLFTQLLVNLIENAIKYGKENGNVWVALEKKENKTLVCISDDGIGISHEDLPKIFERFYRADKARDRKGSGLGLSIVKWIVSLHGGEIFAESRLGEGTKISVAVK